MIRRNDQRPGRPRPPRTKTPRPPSGGRGGGTKKTGCFLIAVPALTALAACASLLAGGMR